MKRISTLVALLCSVLALAAHSDSPQPDSHFNGDTTLDFDEAESVASAVIAIGSEEIKMVEESRHHQETYEVEEMHERLSGPTQGVRFNVETVSAAQPQAMRMPTKTEKDIIDTLKWDAFQTYSDDRAQDSSKSPSQLRIEVASTTPENFVFVGSSGFLQACMNAFAHHLPLALSPDHIWTSISYAFAKHVDLHAEALRKNFVQHEGKKRLLVEADDLVLGQSPPEVWEATIFPEFSKQIKEYIGDDTHGAIAGKFSTTTATSQAAHEITLMAAMKNYFSYGMKTVCGIPTITLLGTEEDWVALRERAEALGRLMTPEFSEEWMPNLLPILDEFVSSYRGQVNYKFWQSMVKLRTEAGSGGSSYVTGWMQNLFPYLANGRQNSHLRPWQELVMDGPDVDEIPSILSSAPVDWDYYGSIYNLHFHAGFSGFSQNRTDGTLTPEMGWFVTHDPPQDSLKRLETVRDEIKALLKGHVEEASAAVLDTCAPWYRRVSVLHSEQVQIQHAMYKELKGLEKQLSCYQENHRDIQNRAALLRTTLKETDAVQRGLTTVFWQRPLSTEDMIRSLVPRSSRE